MVNIRLGASICKAFERVATGSADVVVVYVSLTWSKLARKPAPNPMLNCTRSSDCGNR